MGLFSWRSMARKNSRKVLYEALKKSQEKFAKYSETDKKPALEPVEAEQEQLNGEDQQQEETQQQANISTRFAETLTKMYLQKTKFRVSYPILIIAVLVVLMILLIIVKTASNDGQSASDTSVSDEKQVLTDVNAKKLVTEAVDEKLTISDDNRKPASSGDNRIVIATYKVARDLEPVKKFFDSNRVKTTIQKRGSYYFLVTDKSFQSPNRKGSDGYKALQRIKRLGANYKAPKGYESFAPNLFQDAYGEKIR